MNVLKVDFEKPEAKSLFAQSLHETGFAILENHPIDIQLIDDIYEEWMGFFSNEGKYNYLFNSETQDGYFPQSVSEKAKGAQVKDIKEFYHFYPWGKFPRTLSYKTARMYQQLNLLAQDLLAWLEEYLPSGIAQNLTMPLSDMIKDSQQTLLRILHYPPLTGSEPEGAIRAAAHEDINLLTLLVGATTSGLQVKDNWGNWYDVPCDKRWIVVNNADMLSLATNNYYRSTTHRVVNPQGINTSRLSMPLFLHPRPDVSLSKEKTAKEYLNERLLELGLIS